MVYLKTWIAFVAHHPPLVYGAVFLSSLIESLAIVGLFFPGTMIIFGLGALVAVGNLKLQFVLILAAAGAIIGDGVSFWLGYHYQDGLKRIWPFSRYPRMLKQGEAFFRRHGGKGILFGRFVGPVRAVIPVVAGMLGMRPLQFSLVNVISAVGWAFVYILPGFFFGTSLWLAGEVSARLAALIFVMTAGVWLFVWLTRRLFFWVEHRGPFWLASVKDWANADAAGYKVLRPLKRFLSNLLGRREEEWFLLFLFSILFFAGWGFLGVLQDVLAKDPLVTADQAVYHFFQSLRTPWTDQVLVAVTELGDSFVIISLASAVSLALLVKRRFRAAGFWALTLLGGSLGVQLIKAATNLPRPTALYQGASAYSFPSGHTSMSVILYGFLAILISRGHAVKMRWGLFVSVFLISFIIAVSRLYLGAHWLSDVLGGFLIGATWTALLGILYLKGNVETVPNRLLGIVTVLALLIAGGWHIARRHEQDLALYAPRNAIESVSRQEWIAKGWRNLPEWRIDLAGEMEQPLTLQWAGDSEQITKRLLAEGWRRPPSLNLKNLLRMLSPNTPIEDLPVLPHLHDGRVDSPRLVRRVKAKRWVLRLWRSDMTIKETSMPVFVGTVEVQDLRHIAALITAARDTGDYDLPLDTVESALRSRFSVRSVRRDIHAMPDRNENPPSRWNDRVLLVWHGTSGQPRSAWSRQHLGAVDG